MLLLSFLAKFPLEVTAAYRHGASALFSDPRGEDRAFFPARMSGDGAHVAATGRIHGRLVALTFAHAVD